MSIASSGQTRQRYTYIFCRTRTAFTLVSQNQSQADLRLVAALYLSYWLVIDVSMIQMAVWAGLEPACRSGRLTADWVTIPRTTQ